MTGSEFDSRWGKALSGEESFDEATRRFRESTQKQPTATGQAASKVIQARQAAPGGPADTPEPEALPAPGAAPSGPDPLSDPKDLVRKQVKSLLARRPTPAGMQ